MVVVGWAGGGWTSEGWCGQTRRQGSKLYQRVFGPCERVSGLNEMDDGRLLHGAQDAERGGTQLETPEPECLRKRKAVLLPSSTPSSLAHEVEYKFTRVHTSAHTRANTDTCTRTHRHQHTPTANHLGEGDTVVEVGAGCIGVGN